MSREERIKQIEELMYAPDFWADKDKAKALLTELQELKDSESGGGKYDKYGVYGSIFAGAGGDDSEDFVAMLLKMYKGFAENNGWDFVLTDSTPNTEGGFRSVSFEIKNKNVFGELKGESGVNRLVRISPFNANSKRQTSFAMVEFVPLLPEKESAGLPIDEIEIDFARAGGPGGQNVNKRETAVRVKHIPTGLSVHIRTERTQEANRQKALTLLQAKLIALEEEKRLSEESGMQISKTTDNEWGSQIRSYVMHPYKMVKDHRTEFETSNIDKVLAGELDGFIEAFKAKNFPQNK